MSNDQQKPWNSSRRSPAGSPALPERNCLTKGWMMLTEGSQAVTRMVCAGGGLHSAVVSKGEGSSASTYDIIMVSLSGSLLLLVAIGIAIIVLRRRCTSNRSSKDLSTPVLVENITVTNNSSDKISTVDLTGPVCISYVSDKATGSPDLAISEEPISIFELPFFSFAVSITPPISAPEQ